MEKIIFLIGLSYLSYQDYRKKEVSVKQIMFLGLFGIIFRLAEGGLWKLSLLSGVGIGVLFMVLSLLTGGKVGLGDGLLLMVSGIYLGFWENLSMCMAALYLAAFSALVLIVLKKCKKGTALPFFPFLLAGYVVTLWQSAF